MPRTRVLHVLDHSLPHLSGYAVRSSYLLRAQREWNLDPVAVTSPKHGSDARPEEIDDIKYFRTPATKMIGSRIPGFAEFHLMRRLAARVAEVARSHRAQVVHAHSPVLNGIPALWVARRAGVPVVYEIRAFWEDAAVDHGTHGEESMRYRLIRAMETWLIRRVDAVGVISEGLAGELIRRGIPASKIFRIPNGVDTERFRPAPRDSGLEARWHLKGQTVIGFIGSFYRYEGLDVLLDAWAKIAGQLPAARVLLIGGGEALPALREQAERLNVASSTIFAGSVPHEEIPRCYSVCDVLVYPRKAMRLTDRTTPLKPLEAMAAGRTIVGSDVGGLRELIRDRETGFLFRAGDAGALAGVLCALLPDADLRARLGTNARQWVCREREWKHLVQAHAHTYERLLNGGR